jgi:hypothetical protein
MTSLKLGFSLGAARPRSVRLERRASMIRVRVPIDIGIVVTTSCEAFALATPLRVETLIALAVDEALGPRAPRDKRERTLRSTLASFRAGAFHIDVDGRLVERIDETIMCAGVATLRFFLRRGVRTTT